MMVYNAILYFELHLNWFQGKGILLDVIVRKTVQFTAKLRLLRIQHSLHSAAKRNRVVILTLTPKLNTFLHYGGSSNRG